MARQPDRSTLPDWVRALVITLLTLTCGATPAEWQVSSFEILFARPNPSARTVEAMEDGIRRLAVDQAEILKMERFLHDVAVEYAKMGFADPTASGHLGPVTKELVGDGTAVRVYLLDITSWNRAYTATNVGLAYYISVACDSAKLGGSILIHEPAAFRNGKITDGIYQSLAHELFHAVQAASEFNKSAQACGTGKWITEGTADAIGFDMGRRLRRLTYPGYNTYAPGKASFLKLWGGRRYHAPLPIADPNQSDDYLTSSFWRHLAEWSVSGDHPGSAEAPFDYRYLASLFNRKINGTGPDKELLWLDSWMKSQTEFAVGLAPIYAHFTSSVADHMSTRIPAITGVTPESSRESRWLGRLFQKCPEKTLSKQQPKVPVTLDIEPNAARCVRITVDGDGYAPRQIVIDNSDLNRTEQRQLYIGAMGGQLVTPGIPWTAEPPSANAGKSSVKWDMLAYQGLPTTFIVSNMATDPSVSTSVKPTLHFSIPEWESSMTVKSEPWPAPFPMRRSR